jgi:hypothetical protein
MAPLLKHFEVQLKRTTVVGNFMESSCNVVSGNFPKNTTFQTQVINLVLKAGAIFKGNFPLDYP